MWLQRLANVFFCPFSTTSVVDRSRGRMIRKTLQLVYIGLVLYMLVNILIAVYVAGMSVFVSAVNWGMHQIWGWNLFDPALVLVPLALLAKLPRRLVLISGLLSLLVIVQIF